MFPYDPFEELERIRESMRRLMRKMLEKEFELYRGIPVDISETEDELIIRADLPGFSKDEIYANLTENELEIRAQHRESKEEKSENRIISERRYGSVRRVIWLPTPVDPETAQAKFEHGVLEIRVKKKKAERGRKLDIQ